MLPCWYRRGTGIAVFLPDSSDFRLATLLFRASGSKRISRPWRLYGNSNRCRRTHDSETFKNSAVCLTSQQAVTTLGADVESSTEPSFALWTSLARGLSDSRVLLSLVHCGSVVFKHNYLVHFQETFSPPPARRLRTSAGSLQSCLGCQPGSPCWQTEF
jgi:hypothetical protein